MSKCFGNGKCIMKRKYGYHGYYKPYKCSYNCKLVPCYYCKKTMMPKYFLEDNNGYCTECMRIKYNGKIMDKLFKINSIVSY